MPHVVRGVLKILISLALLRGDSDGHTNWSIANSNSLLSTHMVPILHFACSLHIFSLRKRTSVLVPTAD